ncbi:MAG: hypothetical protein GX421_12515 [Caldisericales bacterium]|nr:hypothetical protein [Caldisericales bacterium]
MPTGIGVVSKAAYHATPSAWAAAWSTVNTQFPIRSEGITQEFLRIQNENLCGSPARKKSDQGPASVKGPIEMDLDYYNHPNLLYYGLGLHDVGSYFGIADQLPDQYFRFEFDKGVSRWRVGSAAMNAFELSGKAGEALKLTMEMICYDIARSATAFPSLSIANCKRVMFDEIAGFLIGDLVDALQTADAQPVQEFKLRFERNLTDPEWDANNPIYSIRPTENGFRKVTLDLTLSRYAADTFLTWMDADTDLQASAVFSDGTKNFYINMPYMKIISAPANIEGPGVIKPKVQLELYRNQNILTGMDSDPGEFWMMFS